MSSALPAIMDDDRFVDAMLFPPEDPSKDDNMKDNFTNDSFVDDNWPSGNEIMKDLFFTDSEFGMDILTEPYGLPNRCSTDDLPDNFLDNDSPPSSDSGLSSALSLSGEQQLSPLLHFEDDPTDLNDKVSPKDIVDFESFGSPNESFHSIDSPNRSTISSCMGSPETDATEEMDFETSIIPIVDSLKTDTSGEIKIPIIKQEPSIEFDASPKPVILKPESLLNMKNTTTACNGKRNGTIQQLFRVAPVGSGNPRSVLLPVNLKDISVKQVQGRTVRLITTAQMKNLKNFKINQGSLISKTIPITIKQEDLSAEKNNQSSDDTSETESTGYPSLNLNAEEKRLLQKEGIQLPKSYPLTKTEERELKRIRRKIRNKISAQDSRKRKKEYVDGLEDRVKQCTEENMTLLKRIKALQTQNQSLAGQLKRLQAMIQKGNKSAQPATCLMVLLLSLALVAAPNLSHRSNAGSNDLTREQEQPENMLSLTSGHTRSLLFSKQLLDDEFHEELLSECEGLLDHDYNTPIAHVPPSKRPRYDNDQIKYVASMDHVGGTLNKQSDTPNIKLTRKYIEPPLDDVWPPPKPNIRQPTKIVDKLEAITNELKINISDSDGTRTVLVKVPQEQSN